MVLPNSILRCLELSVLLCREGSHNDGCAKIDVSFNGHSKGGGGAIAEAEKICATNQVASNVQVHPLGVLSCHLTLCALAKKHSNLPKFESMEEVGVKFIDLLCELSGNGNITCAWSLALTASTSAGILPSLRRKPVCWQHIKAMFFAVLVVDWHSF